MAETITLNVTELSNLGKNLSSAFSTDSKGNITINVEDAKSGFSEESLKKIFGDNIITTTNGKTENKTVSTDKSTSDTTGSTTTGTSTSSSSTTSSGSTVTIKSNVSDKNKLSDAATTTATSGTTINNGSNTGIVNKADEQAKDKASQDKSGVATVTINGKDKNKTADKTSEKDQKKQKEKWEKVHKAAKQSNQVDLDICGRTHIYGFKQSENSVICYPMLKDDFIMGLPPLTMYCDEDAYDRSKVESSTIGNYSFNTYKQMLDSFPILTIQPMEYVSKSITIDLEKGISSNLSDLNKTTSSSSNGRKVIKEVKYKFAIQPQESSSISFSHSNMYEESGIEGNLKSLAEFNTVRELNQLINTNDYTGNEGVMSQALNAIHSAVNTGVGEINAGLGLTAKESKYADVRTIANMGKTMLNMMTAGARIDMGDVWQNSSSSNTTNFKIELRTLSGDPNSLQYFNEIILPLYCLLTLSLPAGGSTIDYTNPPYITAELDKTYWYMPIGGISSISWEAPMTDMTFTKVPRHISVNLELKNMYKVLTQKGYDFRQEKKIQPYKDMITKDELIDRLVKGETKIANQDYWKVEWGGLLTTTPEQRKQNIEDNKKKCTVTANVSASTAKLDKDKLTLGNPFGAINGIANNIKNVASNITNGINKTLAPFKNAVSSINNLLKSGTSAFSNLSSSINALGTALKSPGQIIKNGISSIKSNLNGMISSIKGVGTSLTNLGSIGAGGILAGLVLSGDNCVTKLISGVSNGVTSVVSGIASSTESLGGTIALGGAFSIISGISGNSSSSITSSLNITLSSDASSAKSAYASKLDELAKAKLNLEAAEKTGDADAVAEAQAKYSKLELECEQAKSNYETELKKCISEAEENAKAKAEAKNTAAIKEEASTLGTTTNDDTSTTDSGGNN